MYLPLRLAVALPVISATIVGLGIGLTSPSLRDVHRIDGLPQLALVSFFAAAASLIVVLPNLAAALIANRISDRWLPFIVAFVSVFFVAWLAQAHLLDKGLRGLGGFSNPLEVKMLGLLLANVAICILAAAWIGRPHTV